MKETEQILEAKDLIKFGIKLNTVYTLVHQRKIPHFRLGPRFIRFSESKIIEWLAIHEVNAIEGGLHGEE